MFKDNEINSYENKIDLKRVILEQNLQNTDEALFVCDLSTLKEKYDKWNQMMPRVKPYYGEFFSSIDAKEK